MVVGRVTFLPVCEELCPSQFSHGQKANKSENEAYPKQARSFWAFGFEFSKAVGQK